jgi:hypothetical protein
LRRLTVPLVALAAALAPASAAADTFTVTGSGDGAAACGLDGNCPTLRAAVTSADADPSTTDSIVFSSALDGATITVTATLPVTGPVGIDGGDHVTVEQSGSVSGPLLRLTSGAGGSAVRNITLVGPGPGGAGATSLVSTAASDVTVSNSTLRDATTSGLAIDGDAQRVRASQNTIFGYGTKAISFDAVGVNGGIAAPANLRVGPRRADGTLPITGSTGPGGALEIFRGPQQAYSFATGVGAGDFSVFPAPEPSPGEAFAATITDAAGDTSEYAATVAPDDVVSPFLAGAVATSLTTIEVQASEPIDPASIQPDDFDVEMAGVTRPVVGTTVSGDGTRITLFFQDAWEAGEAGLMRLTAPGAIADPAGNVSLAPADKHVGGAPGDFIAPVITGFRLKPNRGICFVAGPRCKRERTAIIFRSSEDGDTYITVFRGSRRLGERRYTGQSGDNYIRFDGKIRGRRIKPGRYTMYVAMEDEVGNRTPFAEQPHATFRVKSTRGR